MSYYDRVARDCLFFSSFVDLVAQAYMAVGVGCNGSSMGSFRIKFLCMLVDTNLMSFFCIHISMCSMKCTSLCYY